MEAHRGGCLSSQGKALQLQPAPEEETTRNPGQKIAGAEREDGKPKAGIILKFALLIKFVDCEHQATLSRLDEKEEDIEQKLHANIRTFSEHISTMESLLMKVAKMSVMADVNLLMDVRSVLPRCDSLQSLTFHSVQPQKKEFRLPPPYSAFQKILQKFREDVTLDPKTAHPYLRVSKDRKCVTFVKKRQRVHWNPKRFLCHPMVVGFEGFACGWHYWEVQVNDKPMWAVGVCKDSLPRKKGEWPLSGQSMCWAILL
ncbi:hypothetical protein P7K49_005743 [Saguinus oedipus]|uniref:B30.2/SPRY domain-containing protein n=1 Tax=Saguinus oedipus TaxID=9490 RepID=A0ABQ9W405_SAGOE|nr:hypothetical protein P7K49_005743 [Saguinus oedipus]